ncbi:lmo0937 family membrane protein [Segetibacter sp. 3557_3]|uniref:lmo0937 family membrane protein n=1 Tax=Segetibacter sp. 3557_3 TaxID=2547429 RepID=UPI002938D2A1|nr:lmo0937 family membrane protein [Segetibacter sp. 3557_3]
MARFFNLLCKHTTMRSILYIIAVIAVVGWLLGFFVYNATGLIHILLVLAIIALLIGVIRRA